MKKILVLGAGRSSSSLITWLLENSGSNGWKITVTDSSLELAASRVDKHPNGSAGRIDIRDSGSLGEAVLAHDIIVSMLPPAFHTSVAEECVKAGRHMATASYVSKEMAALSSAAHAKGVILLNELGLDPGLDHMSAMEVIERIREEGGRLVSFKSWCGGLVAPESDDNPWGYKFSWNPRNVILAGQGTAQYLEGGQIRFVPYNRLFAHAEKIRVKGLGEFDGYLNRDSLSYINPYGLTGIQTMVRGTLRKKGFCSAWNVLIALGLTDDTWRIPGSEKMKWSDLVDSLLPAGKGSLKKRVARVSGVSASSPEMKKVEWLGIFSSRKTGVANATPAMALQALLEEKWKLKSRDKDMIVMQHEFIYTLKGKRKKIVSSLVETGKDQVHTAMARTVGLPLAIGVKLIAQDRINARGVIIPTLKEIYKPVLEELRKVGIEFDER